MSIYFAILVLLVKSSLSAIFSGQFSNYQSYLSLTHFTTTTNNYITFTTIFTPANSQAILVISTTPIVPSVDANDWKHIDPKSQTNFDYQGLVTGQTQYAWIGHPGSGVTVYFYLVNFEKTSKPNFVVVINEPIVLSRACSSGSYYGSTVYCSNCLASTLTGVYCNIPYTQIQLGQLKTILVNANSYALATISTQSSATIQIKSSSSGIFVYFQYNNRNQQAAGLVNHIQGGTYNFLSSGFYYITLSNLDKDVSIGIVNSNSQTAQVQIQYVSTDNQSYLYIIVAVIGGLVFLGIVVILVVMIKKNFESTRRQIHPHITGMQQILRQSESQKLSNNQIEEYFPKILKSDLFSISHLNSSIDLSLSDHQCVICLCPIEATELIRVCYCRHIFHQNCLLKWFQKQQNCPYCRRNFEKKATLLLYSQLNKQNGGTLKGTQISQAIFRPKQNLSLQTLQITDIEEQFK